MVVAPLVYEGKTVGALKVFSNQPRAFSARDVDTVQLTAGLLGAALDHAQAYRDKERSEAIFRAVSKSTHEAIITTAAGGRIVFCNPAVTRVFGYEAHELLGTSYERLLPARLGLQPEHLDGVTVGGVTVQTRGQRKDGSEFAVEVSLARWEAEGQRYTTGIVRDVTERHLVERLKDELISVVSHELRTPLTSIRGSLGLLAGGLLQRSPEKPNVCSRSR
jgi:PAS domain S-box-containing protein